MSDSVQPHRQQSTRLLGPSLGFSRQEHWSGLPFLSPMHETEKWKWSRSVKSNSSRSHGLQPSRLLRPWDFPGKSTGVGCHCLLHLDLLDKSRSWGQMGPEPWTLLFPLLSSGHGSLPVHWLTLPPSTQGGRGASSACQCGLRAWCEARGICKSLLNPHAFLLHHLIWFDLIWSDLIFKVLSMSC